VDATQIICSSIPVLGSIVVALINRPSKKAEPAPGSRRVPESTVKRWKVRPDTIAIISAGIALSSCVFLVWQIFSNPVPGPRAYSSLAFFPANELKSSFLTGRGSQLANVDRYNLPSEASGVILAVQLTVPSADSAAFTCGTDADALTKYNVPASVSEGQLIATSTVAAGGLVFCPFDKKGNFFWKVYSAASVKPPVVVNGPTLQTVATAQAVVIGWYRGQQ
jgi:hypothetical protein